MYTSQQLTTNKYATRETKIYLELMYIIVKRPKIDIFSELQRCCSNAVTTVHVVK